MGKSTKRSSEKPKETLEPRAPGFLQELKWFWLYGRANWKVVLVGGLIIVISFVGKMAWKKMAESKGQEANPTIISPNKPFTNSIGMKFVPVPNTKVLFSIWETRVQDFRAFVAATGYQGKPGTYKPAVFVREGWYDEGTKRINQTENWENWSFNQTDNDPVCFINAEDAESFCNWLSQKDGRKYRLPTKVERAAAEAGYPNKEQFPKDGKGQFAGNYKGDEDGYLKAAPVGSFPSNNFGIFDLRGNVSELIVGSKKRGSGSDWDYDFKDHGIVVEIESPDENYRGYATGFRVILEQDSLQ